MMWMGQCCPHLPNSSSRPSHKQAERADTECSSCICLLTICTYAASVRFCKWATTVKALRFAWTSLPPLRAPLRGGRLFPGSSGTPRLRQWGEVSRTIDLTQGVFCLFRLEPVYAHHSQDLHQCGAARMRSVACNMLLGNRKKMERMRCKLYKRTGSCHFSCQSCISQQVKKPQGACSLT
jgi:hypothetical protein